MELREKIAWGVALVSLATTIALGLGRSPREGQSPKEEPGSAPNVRNERMKRPDARVKRPPAQKGAEELRPPQGAGPVPEVTDAVIGDAIKKQIEVMRKERKAMREKRKEEMLKLSDEEKSARREAFISKMHERAEKRMKEFVQKTGLNAAQTEAFATTIAALDATLQERTQEWAEKIRSTKTFNQDARMKFVGDVVEVINAGYAEMDASLPATWRTDDGNFNLVQLVGDAAFASVAEALVETGLEDGLQTIGMLMGVQGGSDRGEGPEGRGPGEEGGFPEGGPDGANGPGGSPDGANGPGGMGMGGPGPGGSGM